MAQVTPAIILDTIRVVGSWGELIVHRQTGYIVRYDDHGRYMWDACDNGYHDILWVIPETLAPGRCACLDEHGCVDILDIGFVDLAGRVTMPMLWAVGMDERVDPAGLLDHRP